MGNVNNGENELATIHKKYSLGLVTIAVLGALGSPTLQAADGAKVDGALDKNLEVIVVTSQKRTEKLIDVPLSIAVFGDEDIENSSSTQLKEISQYVPNLSISSGNDFSSTVSIRGVGSQSRNIGFDSRVGVYLDGVYLGQSPALNQELLDLVRVEVLRGPQGTLFGKNTVAGAINLISKKPQDEFSGTVGLDVGNLNARQYSVGINVPLSDNVFVKVSVNQQERDGTVKNLETGNLLKNTDVLSYRAQLLYVVSDSFEANLAIDGLSSDQFAFNGDPVTNIRGTALNTEAPEHNEVRFDIDPTEERDITGEMLTLDWELDNGYAVKSISAHRSTEISYINDTDYSTMSVVHLDYSDDYDQLSQEIQLISPEGDFQYVAGLYYYQQDGYTERLPFVGEDAIEAFTGVSRSTFEAGAELGDPTSIFYLGFFNPGTLTTEGDVTTESYAAFLNGSYQISKQLKFNFGFRYSTESKDVDWEISSLDPVTGVPVAPVFGIGNGIVKDSRTDNDFSPMLSLSYHINDNINTYVKYSTGYKSGGYNVDFLTQNQLDAGIEFDKETVKSYEAGIKGNVLDQDLRFSLVGFVSNYTDYQTQQFVQLDGGATALSIRNAAEVKTKGLELELNYAATEQLNLRASIGLLDGELTEFPNGGIDGADVSGRDLPGIADYSYSLGLQYYYPVPSMGADLMMVLDYNYQDDYGTTIDGERELELSNGDTIAVGQIDGFGIFNARIGFKSHDDKWRVFLWSRNLADEDTAINFGTRDFLGTRRNTYLLPRTFGLELQYQF